MHLRLNPEILPDSSHFHCVICEEDHHHAPHFGMRKRGEVNEPPICIWCVRRWGRKLASMKRGREKILLMRLSAIIARLEWEMFNGKHGKFADFYARVAAEPFDRSGDIGPGVRLRVPPVRPYQRPTGSGGRQTSESRSSTG